MITVRRAGALDARPMAELLNEIIAIGGTTAMTRAVTAAELRVWMQAYPGQSILHLAEDAGGEVLGMQWVEPHPDLPDDALNISSFVRSGRHNLGIGGRLFDATRGAAKAMGYTWINASIRADNAGGLVYYQSRGFEPYARRSAVTLDNGVTVDKISKRFDL